MLGIECEKCDGSGRGLPLIPRLSISHVCNACCGSGLCARFTSLEGDEIDSKSLILPSISGGAFILVRDESAAQELKKMPLFKDSQVVTPLEWDQGPPNWKPFAAIIIVDPLSFHRPVLERIVKFLENSKVSPLALFPN